MQWWRINSSNSTQAWAVDAGERVFCCVRSGLGSSRWRNPWYHVCNCKGNVFIQTRELYTYNLICFIQVQTDDVNLIWKWDIPGNWHIAKGSTFLFWDECEDCYLRSCIVDKYICLGFYLIQPIHTCLSTTEVASSFGLNNCEYTRVLKVRAHNISSQGCLTENCRSYSVVSI